MNKNVKFKTPITNNKVKRNSVPLNIPNINISINEIENKNEEEEKSEIIRENIDELLSKIKEEKKEIKKIK